MRRLEGSWHKILSTFPKCIKFPWGIHPATAEKELLTVPTDDELADKFESCLAAAKCEQDIQNFLEKYPHILPGLDTFHHGPMAQMIVTKFPLNVDFVTDFAFVSENSQCLEITFVEIESPKKRIFNKNGSFSRDYLDARQQLADWNGWAQHNLRNVAALFGPMEKFIFGGGDCITLRSILIIGRRSELTSRKRQQRWAAENALRAASMNIMTYDRLLERTRLGLILAFEQTNTCLQLL